MKNKHVINDTKLILKKLIIKYLLKLNRFLFFRKINKIIELNHEDIDVAIGIIINPTVLK